jgi:ABC-type Fe3+-hydroxamate transport system substrate-binding protein
MTFWGSTAVGIDRLAAFRDVDVLCFDHGNEREMQTLMATPLWQAMPFVREALPACARGLVLRRDAVGDAFCPRAG